MFVNTFGKRPADALNAPSPKKHKVEEIYVYTRENLGNRDGIPEEFQPISLIQLNQNQHRLQSKNNLEIKTEKCTLIIEGKDQGYYERVLPFLIANCKTSEEKLELFFATPRNFNLLASINKREYPKEILLYLFLHGDFDQPNESQYHEIFEALLHPDIDFSLLNARFTGFNKKILKILENLHQEEFFLNVFKLIEKDGTLSFLEDGYTIERDEDFNSLCVLIEQKKKINKYKNIIYNPTLQSVLTSYCSERNLDYCLNVYEIMEIMPDQYLLQQIQKENLWKQETHIKLQTYLRKSVEFTVTNEEQPSEKVFIQILENKHFDDEAVLKLLLYIAQKGSHVARSIFKEVFSSSLTGNRKIDFYSILLHFLNAYYKIESSVAPRSGDRVFACYIVLSKLEIPNKFWEQCDKYYKATPPSGGWFLGKYALPKKTITEEKVVSLLKAKKEPIQLEEILLQSLWKMFPYEYPVNAVVAQFCGNNLCVNKKISDFLKVKILDLLPQYYAPRLEEYLFTANFQCRKEASSELKEPFSPFTVSIIHQYFNNHLLDYVPILNKLHFCQAIVKYNLVAFPQIKHTLKSIISCKKFITSVELKYISLLHSLKNAVAGNWFTEWLDNIYRRTSTNQQFYIAQASVSFINSLQHGHCHNINEFSQCLDELMSLDVKEEAKRAVELALAIFSDFVDEDYLLEEIKNIRSKFLDNLQSNLVCDWLQNRFAKHYRFYNNISKYQDYGQLIGVTECPRPDDWFFIDNEDTLSVLSSKNYCDMVTIAGRIPKNPFFTNKIAPVSDDRIHILKELENERILCSIDVTPVKTEEGVEKSARNHNNLSFAKYSKFVGELVDILQNNLLEQLQVTTAFHPSQLFELYTSRRNKTLFSVALAKYFNFTSNRDLLPLLGDLEEFLYFIETNFQPQITQDTPETTTGKITICECTSFLKLLSFWIAYPSDRYLICSSATSYVQVLAFITAFKSSTIPKKYVLAFIDQLDASILSELKTLLFSCMFNDSHGSLVVFCYPRSFSMDSIAIEKVPDVNTTELLDRFLTLQPGVSIHDSPFNRPDLVLNTHSSEVDILFQLNAMNTSTEIQIIVDFTPHASAYHLLATLFKLIVLKQLESPTHLINIHQHVAVHFKSSRLVHLLNSDLKSTRMNEGPEKRKKLIKASHGAVKETGPHPINFSIRNLIHLRLATVLKNPVLAAFGNIFSDSGNTTHFSAANNSLEATKKLNQFINDLVSLFKLPPADKVVSVNDVLKSRIFYIFICIVCKVPLILNGQSASSKSIAMRIVYYNLRRKKFFMHLKNKLKDLDMHLPPFPPLIEPETYFKVFICVGNESEDRIAASLSAIHYRSQHETFFPIVVFESITSVNILKRIQNYLFTSATPLMSVIVLSNICELDETAWPFFFVAKAIPFKKTRREVLRKEYFRDCVHTPDEKDFEQLIKDDEGALRSVYYAMQKIKTEKNPEIHFKLEEKANYYKNCVQILWDAQRDIANCPEVDDFVSEIANQLLSDTRKIKIRLSRTANLADFVYLYELLDHFPNKPRPCRIFKGFKAEGTVYYLHADLDVRIYVNREQLNEISRINELKLRVFIKDSTPKSVALIHAIELKLNDQLGRDFRSLFAKHFIHKSIQQFAKVPDGDKKLIAVIPARELFVFHKKYGTVIESLPKPQQNLSFTETENVKIIFTYLSMYNVAKVLEQKQVFYKKLQTISQIENLDVILATSEQMEEVYELIASESKLNYFVIVEIQGTIKLHLKQFPLARVEYIYCDLEKLDISFDYLLKMTTKNLILFYLSPLRFDLVLSADQTWSNFYAKFNEEEKQQFFSMLFTSLEPIKEFPNLFTKVASDPIYAHCTINSCVRLFVHSFVFEQLLDSAPLVSQSLTPSDFLSEVASESDWAPYLTFILGLLASNLLSTEYKKFLPNFGSLNRLKPAKFTEKLLVHLFRPTSVCPSIIAHFTSTPTCNFVIGHQILENYFLWEAFFLGQQLVAKYGKYNFSVPASLATVHNLFHSALRSPSEPTFIPFLVAQTRAFLGKPCKSLSYDQFQTPFIYCRMLLQLAEKESWLQHFLLFSDAAAFSLPQETGRYTIEQVHTRTFSVLAQLLAAIPHLLAINTKAAALLGIDPDSLPLLRASHISNDRLFTYKILCVLLQSDH